MREMDEDYAAFVAVELPGLVRLGHALTGSEHDAWDLAQETLLRVGLHWRRLDRSESPSRYARTTLVRLNISRWRRLRREVLGDTPDVRLTEPEVQVLSTPLEEALLTLGPRQRTTIVLRHLYDLSLAEIAEEMDCSVGTVKSQLSRAGAQLRARLAPADPSPSPRALMGDLP